LLSGKLGVIKASILVLVTFCLISLIRASFSSGSTSFSQLEETLKVSQEPRRCFSLSSLSSEEESCSGE